MLKTKRSSIEINATPGDTNQVHALDNPNYEISPSRSHKIAVALLMINQIKKGGGEFLG